MIVRQCTAADAEAWASLRHALWPNSALDDLRDDIVRMLARPDRFAGFTVGEDAGFAEVSLRYDYVESCDTSPVGFLEGIYVREPHRRAGLARALCAAAELWVRARGCSEFASDALLVNDASHAMHRALGFAETQRVVYFRKDIGPTGQSP